MPLAENPTEHGLVCKLTHPLPSTGDTYFKETLPRHRARQPGRSLCGKAGGSLSPPPAQMSHGSVFLSLCLPSVSVSSLDRAEPGFSLGPQSHGCSQLSTSNTGDREGKATRREQRNIMDKTNVIHLLWVIWSGFHFLVYIRSQGVRKCQQNAGPRDPYCYFMI